MSSGGERGGGLTALLRRAPVHVLPEASIRDALKRMDAERVGAVVIADQALRPLGVMTLRDMIERVVLPSIDLDVPVVGVMTGGVVALPGDASPHLARLMLARHGLRHLVVTDGAGRLVGVLSRSDLYASRFAGSDDLVEAIQSARGVDSLAQAAARVREAATAMVELGEGSGAVGEWIAMLNDLVVQAAIDLAEAEIDIPLVPWCWLAFGSEGRLEQTLATDQDNGLIFACGADDDPEALRKGFLPFARRVNELLDACGFPLCKGEVMAGNPRWCLSLGEWRACFAGWMRSGTADDLLNATIFFDFRPLAGDWQLAAALQRWLLGLAADTPLFLRFMATNALRGGPPLGVIRDFSVDRETGLIDLKRDGSRLFVDAARIYALALGIGETATVSRLQAAGEALKWPRREVRALLDAFGFIQQLRLASPREPGGAANQIAPASLSELERAFLKESFRQARRLQQKLQVRYQL
jgi:CBS domain-containing protein